jgi:hypothetical protein
VILYFEGRIGVRVLQMRMTVTRVQPNRHVELAATSRARRPIPPRIAFRIVPEGEGVRLTSEIEPCSGAAGAGLDAKELDAVRRHMRERSKNLKGLLEGDPFVSAVEPVLTRLRAAVEENPDFTLVACGALGRGADGSLTFGVECERADGTFPGLRLAFRCSRQPPGDEFRGTLGALVLWHRPPPHERTVYEARRSEIRFAGPPPIDEFLPQLHRLEQVLRTALARRGPPGRTVKVYIVESEAGWGRRIDEAVEFITREEAVQYAEEYNRSFNSGPIRSEWSMIAKVEREDGYSVLS